MLIIQEAMRRTLVKIDKERQGSAKEGEQEQDSTPTLAIAEEQAQVSNFLHNPTVVGVDSCSGRSVSSERSDFLSLDSRPEIVSQVAVYGVGGSAGVAGVGPMVVTVELPQYGRQVLMVDPQGVYVTGGSRLRIFSKSRLRAFGLVMRATGKIQDAETLVCTRSGREIPLEEDNGITVVRTVPKDARNYKRNRGLLHAIGAIARCEQSALYVNDTYVVQGGDRAIMTIGGLEQAQVEQAKEYRCDQLAEFKRESRSRVSTEAGLVGQAVRLYLSKCMVMNMRKLTPVQRARLMHWRFGHCAPDMPVNMTLKGLVQGVDVRHTLVEDCVVCDKAKFRRAPFYRVPSEGKKEYPPYWCVYADAMGGQRSMGVPSIGGAVGNVIFTDVCSGDIKSLLYSEKSQFPDLLERYLLGVLALQYVVRIVRLDGDQVNISARVEEFAARYQ